MRCTTIRRSKSLTKLLAVSPTHQAATAARVNSGVKLGVRLGAAVLFCMAGLSTVPCADAAPITPPAPTHGHIAYPKPITLDPDQPGKVPDFVLSAPGVTTVIIRTPLDGEKKYRFPYWGGDAILKQFVTYSTGQDLPIITPEQYEASDQYKGKDVYRIWMGKTPKPVQENIGSILDKIDDDGFVIKAVGGHDLYISGKYYWGTHFAPYDLLERAADCRWYLSEPRFWMPKEDGVLGIGDIVPKTQRLTIPGNTLIIEEPSFRSRQYRVVPQHSFRIRYRDKFHHALVNIFPPATLGKTHPELFPLIDGKRYVPPAGHEYNFQPCISNPMTVDIAVQKASEAFDNGESTFSVGMNDSGNYCQCDNCKAMAPASLTDKNQRIAYSYAVWYNQIAARLQKKYPDKRLGMLAYGSLSSLPPNTIKLNPMIVPYLTRDSAQLFDKNEQVEFRDLVDRWSRMSSHMGIYEYAYGMGFFIPRLYNRYILKNIQDKYGVNADGFYAEAYPRWSLDGQKYWFMAKMLWNTNYDIPSIEADFYNHMFGQAASQMKDYFDFLEETWCTQTIPSKRSNYRWMYDPTQMEIFTPEKCDVALGLLQKARNAADTDDARKRIEFFASGFAVTNQLARRYDVDQKIKALTANPDSVDQKALLKQLDLFGKLASMNTINDLRIKAGLEDEKTTNTFMSRWSTDQQYIIAINTLIQDLATKVTSNWQGGSQADMEKAADNAITQLPLDDMPQLKARLSDLLKHRGLLFVRSLPSAPDAATGKINPDQWGQPVFDGHFFNVYTAGDLSPQTTRIYAGMVDGQPDTLYMAMDCLGDPVAMGADLKDIDTDKSYPLKMRFDDAVVLNRRYAGLPYIQYRVNLLGVQGPKASKSFTASVSKNDNGWQATMVIASGTFGAPTINPMMHVAISRYERLPAIDPKSKDKKLSTPQAQATTLVPVAKIGHFVGAGNHDTLMSFIWGPVLIYEKPAKTEPPVKAVKAANPVKAAK